MKKLTILIFLFFIVSLGNMFPQNLICDGDFESRELVYRNSTEMGALQEWNIYYKPDSIPMLSEDGSVLFMVESDDFRGPILRLKDPNNNHFVHVNPVFFPDDRGLDLRLWQNTSLVSGAYELRFKVRSKVTSFQSDVVDPAFPGVQVSINDLNNNNTNIATIVTSFNPSSEWRTHIVNFSVKNSESLVQISFLFDRYCRIDLDDIELIPLSNIIPTYKALLPVVLQNEGLADFESGNYSSTLSFYPNHGISFTNIPAFPTINDASRFKPIPVGGVPYDKDTVFYTPYISQGADPMQGGISWKIETKNLTLDSLNSHRASLMTPMVNAISTDGQPTKLKIIFWARTEGKDMVLRVDNLAGSGSSTAPRKVQNVLISGIDFKEYIINDTMSAVMPRQEMYMVKPRYRFNFLTPYSTLLLDYIRFEYWDGISEGSPDYNLKTGFIDLPFKNMATIIKQDKNLTININEPVLLQIYSSSGVLAMAKSLYSSTTINIERLKGLHIVKLNGKTVNLSKKFIF